MALEMAKYRKLFLEEAGEHLSEISRALLSLEKDPEAARSIDVIFRMAHSIKSMAASLEYESITELAHALEDRMEGVRTRGKLADGTEMAALFQGLEGLEAMVAVVAQTGEAPPARPDLIASIRTRLQSVPGPPLENPERGGPPRPVQPQPPPGPQASVRVRTEVLDRFLGAVGEVILSSSQLRTAAGEQQMSAELSAGFDRVERRVTELQRRAMDLRTTPLLRVMEILPRSARQLGEQLGKPVEVELVGTELDLDRSILDRLNEPLLHLVRNAVDQGIEPREVRVAAGKDEVGHISIAARRERDSIVIDVQDDGAGIDLESVRRRAVEVGLLHPDLAEDLPPREVAALIFQPGISTAKGVSAVSGRGVGMDAVKATIESLGGVVELRTERGVGTTTTVVVPITAAVQRVLLCSVSGERVALPITKVERILELPAASIERSGPESFALIDDEPVLVLDLAERLAVVSPPPSEVVPLVVVDIRGESVAVRVERFEGQQEIYVKPVPELLCGVRLLAGFTVLGDGSPVFLLDLNHLA